MTTDDTPEIEVEGLSKSFGRRPALREVGFSVEAGGFLAIFGPNGAGKTTILRILATLLAPGGGRVCVAGHDVRQDPMPVRAAIGVVSHAPLLYGDLTAHENLRFYADMYGLADREARVGELLERLELSPRRDDLVRTFSRGLRQRLAIARAILHRPRVLLLDEPYAGLDPRAVGILDALLAEIRRDHTFVMVTHAMEKGLELATQAIIIEAGEVVLRSAGPIDAAAFGAAYHEHVSAGPAV